MLEKPILGLTPENGAAATLLRRLGCMVVPPRDVDAVERSLLTIVEQCGRCPINTLGIIIGLLTAT